MKNFFILFILLLGIPISSFASETIEPESAKGRVIKIISDTKKGVENETDNFSTDLSYRVQTVRVKILNGKFKDEIFEIEHSISGNFAYDIVLENNSEVMLSIMYDGEDNPNIVVTDLVRDKYLFALVILFIALLILIGGFKGLKSVITLVITGLVIIKIMLPFILKGFNPLIVTTLCAIFISLMTFFIVGGVNSKSISAIIGTTGGVLFAGILAYMVGSLVKLTGLSSEEASMLVYIPQNVNFDFRGLLFSGIIVGTLGAVMDVAMSISSSMYELKEISPELSYKSLVQSGLNIGKDIMGTMSNTLILAYTGSSIPLLLLFMSYSTSISKILNLDLIATEIVRALVGSIGLVVSIPITAVCAGFILSRNSIKKDQ